MHSKCNSLHLLTPNSQSIPPTDFLMAIRIWSLSKERPAAPSEVGRWGLCGRGTGILPRILHSVAGCPCCLVPPTLSSSSTLLSPIQAARLQSTRPGFCPERAQTPVPGLFWHVSTLPAGTHAPQQGASHLLCRDQPEGRVLAQHLALRQSLGCPLLRTLH